MPPQRLEAWLRLIRTPGLGAVYLRRLVETLGAPEAALAASGATLSGVGLGRAQIEALQARRDLDVSADLAWLAADAQRHLIPFDDARYPVRLAEIPAAPAALFVRGDPEVLALPQLAVVGSRSATPQGEANARAFAGSLAGYGLTVTSGLAAGIDGAAHEGALAGGGLTVAVCATGLDRVYPARHRDLAHRVAGQGALVSEFPLGVTPRAEYFPRRNRVISGLSLGVLVVEAALDSGSLITARLALEQGREVFAIPGSIHNPQARGCHRLIRDGAKLVESVADILEELGPQIGPALVASGLRPSSGATPMETENEPPLLRALGGEQLDFDTLLARTGMPLADLSSALLALELEGRVVQGPDGRYGAVHRLMR